MVYGSSKFLNKLFSHVCHGEVGIPFSMIFSGQFSFSEKLDENYFCAVLLENFLAVPWDKPKRR